MATSVLLKKSSVVGKVPTPADLQYGEVALNFADGRLYFKNNSGEIEYFEKSGGFVEDFTILANNLDCGVLEDAVLNLVDLDEVTASTTATYDLGLLTLTGLIYPTQLVLPTFTIATLPSVFPAAQMIFVSDDEGGASIAFSDGTNWRRVSDRSIIN